MCKKSKTCEFKLNEKRTVPRIRYNKNPINHNKQDFSFQDAKSSVRKEIRVVLSQ
jgi:hypothetical protein